MIKHQLLALALITACGQVQAQCDSTNISSDYTISADVLLGGTYVVNGTFTVPSGVTVYVSPYSVNGCGELRIYADNIVIEGTINGDYAGYQGGSGGAKGTGATSATGDAMSLTSCNNKDNQGHIAVAGGFGGENGAGPGAGEAGADGSDGSGTKQWCGSSGDEAGLVGGAGGAGGGAGGSYGGAGSAGANGGGGAATATTVSLSVESSYGVVAGSGGAGGNTGSLYGTAAGRDIAIGSGGAGAGGGGRSYYLGTNGGNGGNGGGMVFLKADNSLSISGTITVAGGDGTSGGNGGSGDATADCCSDGCNGCDERTFSAGAGSGSGAGGGSGGGIFLESLGTADVSGVLIASGGDGGSAGPNGAGISCDYDGGVFCGTQSITTADGFTGSTGGAGGGGRVKIYVLDCAEANLNATVNVAAGSGNLVAGVGSYEEVCGYTSLNELQHSIGWMVYPNPFEDAITVEILSGVHPWEVSGIEVLNTLGQRVAWQAEVSGVTTVEVPGVPAGVYLVRVLTDSKTEVKRIVKK